MAKTIVRYDRSAAFVAVMEGSSSCSLGDLVGIDASGTVQQATADSAATPLVAVGVAGWDASAGARVLVLPRCVLHDTVGGLTQGATCYLSDTAGATTQTANTTNGDLRQVVGVARSDEIIDYAVVVSQFAFQTAATSTVAYAP